MTTGERKASLLGARYVLTDVARSLNGGGSTCPACGLLRKSNWIEAQVQEQLEGMCERITRIVDRLENAERARPAKESTDESHG